MQQTIIIQAVQSEEDILISEHFYKMWIDVGVPEDGIEDNWQEIILQFIKNARASAKIRTGMPKDDEADYDLPVWAGILPLELIAGNPISDSQLPKNIPLPGYVHNCDRTTHLKME